MPLNDGPAKRTLSDENAFRHNPRAPYVEFAVASAFSFLRAASEPVDLVAQANLLGYDAIGIADRNSMAGVVRMWSEGRTARVDSLTGCRLVLTCGTELLAYPQDRAAYGRLCALLSAGKMRGLDGRWQAKDRTEITLEMLSARAEGLHLIACPGDDLGAFERGALPRLRAALPLGHLAASMLYRGDDRARVNRLDAMAATHGLTLLATNDVLYHHPARRPLQDVLACIREGVSIDAAGTRLLANAERHLKRPEEMVRLFADWPHAIEATRALADRIAFRLSDLRYEYLDEVVPEGSTPARHLRELTLAGAADRYPAGVPPRIRATIEKELALIGRKQIEPYFLTIHDIVRWAREEVDPPILCQGRGSAANSVVCFCLGITSVDPTEHDLLFERFLSDERDEPPDIDIDFEHERRELVIQHIYRKYGRERAGLVATVIHYRPRSAIREVGKVMGLSEDVTARLAGTVWGHFESSVGDDRVTQAGLDLTDPLLRLVLTLARQLIGLPRHLSQHVGGFVLTRTPLVETVPIGNGAMPERSFIEWDKDDVEALRIYKLDVLALGMLTCIQKGFDLIRLHHGVDHDLATVPREHDLPDTPGNRPTYDMLCRGESLGVFQIESRAQMAMLPKLRPRTFYDLVIEVAIVRPGPIQGDMVHPYLRNRRRLQADPDTVFDYPKPGPEHPADELERILGRTLGVPIFQEQAMKIALVAAEFTPAEANRLRKAMATFRNRGEDVRNHKARMVDAMTARGYDPEFAARCFSQIEGFGEYGFPESHAASFAKLVYVSSWMKWHHPAIFACALLNSQPMGFYAPAQIVRDARDNGVGMRPPCVTASTWDCTLSREGGPGTRDVGPRDAGLSLRLGLRMIDGLRRASAERIAAARAVRPFADPDDLRARASLDARDMRCLAGADALVGLDRTRREGTWEVMGQSGRRSPPLFEAASVTDQVADRGVTLPPARLSEDVVADYQTTRLSLRAHPMSFFRASLDAQGYTPAAALGRKGHGALVRVAGLVLVRQKPGSAKGVCFVTLEDESGVVNLVVWPDRFERWRAVLMGARLMRVRGRVQTDGQVIHVVADEVGDSTHALARLSDASLPATTARGDHPTNPLPNQADTMPGTGRHPRDVRPIQPSRDFH
ncbi:MAG: error-prone DNA polymerase [Paracoccaceae bacterium]